MSFLTTAALAVALLVAAPLAAHLLRRRRAEEHPFPPARLVMPTAPKARRRSVLEDRALFATRALAIVTLALLGATPFVHCSRLSFTRDQGASVAMAIVLDDSLSMRAPLSSGRTRFEAARTAALELCDQATQGDALGVVLAGSPARVALATTNDLALVRDTLEGIEPTDRSTDLDGAVDMATSLVKGAPQRDRRVVLLSDLADGREGAAPLRGSEDAALWVPLEELRASGSDCAVIRADRLRNAVVAEVVCHAAGDATPWSGRSLELRAGRDVLASTPLPSPLTHARVSLDVSQDAPDGLWVSLTPAEAADPATAGATAAGAIAGDAIAEDDRAPVVPAGAELSIAVVADPTTSRVATGGPPPVEQALAALGLGESLRPLPDVPEDPAELARHGGLIVDDSPGFTPEVRRTLTAWVESGGVLLLTLGPRAAAAPLGAGFEPLVSGVIRWGDSPVSGVDPKTASVLGPSAVSLEELGPSGRASLDVVATRDAEVLAAWSDSAPLLIRHPLGRGMVYVLTLPLDTTQSDLALRPAFLALLDRVVTSAKSRGGARMVETGQSWTFDGYDRVAAEFSPAGGDGEARPLDTTDRDGQLRVAAPWVGSYLLTLDGERTIRFAGIGAQEIVLEPRPHDAAAPSAELGGVAPQLDASPYVALILLGLVTLELLLRFVSALRRGGERAAAPEG